MPCSTTTPAPAGRPGHPRKERAAERPPAGHGPEGRWNGYIERIAAGDSQALAALYDESRALVYGLTLRILGHAAEAEEVALEIYLQVWHNAGNFDPGRGEALGWLVMLARSRAIDRLRGRSHRQRQRELPLEVLAGPAAGSPDSPEESAWLGERERIIRAALATLSAEQRRAVELAFYQGLTHVELAARLRLPLGTVKTHLRRGLCKLREQLGVLRDASAKTRPDRPASVLRERLAAAQEAPAGAAN